MTIIFKILVNISVILFFVNFNVKLYKKIEKKVEKEKNDNYIIYTLAFSFFLSLQPLLVMIVIAALMFIL